MNAPVTVQTPIYLDYLSTTPVDPRVVQVMSDCLSTEGVFGNPASRSHVFGWKAEEAVENARNQVAELINTSGIGKAMDESESTPDLAMLVVWNWLNSFAYSFAFEQLLLGAAGGAQVGVWQIRLPPF